MGLYTANFKQNTACLSGSKTTEFPKHESLVMRLARALAITDILVARQPDLLGSAILIEIIPKDAAANARYRSLPAPVAPEFH